MNRERKKPETLIRSGVIQRVVGNSIVYFSTVDTGDALTFTPDSIEQYRGQSLSSLKFKVGAEIKFTVDAQATIRVKRLNAKTFTAKKKSRVATRADNDSRDGRTTHLISSSLDGAASCPTAEKQLELHPDSDAKGIIAAGRALPPATRKFGKLVDISCLQPGDLVLTREVKVRSRVSKLISSVQDQGGYGQNDSRWVHAAMYLGDGSNLVEATFENPLLGGDVRITSLDEYCDGSNVLRFRRSKYVQNEKDGWRICVRAMSRLRDKYDVLQAVKLWIKVKLGGGFYEAKKEATSSAVVCSTLYADSYNEAMRRSLGEVSGICVPAWLSLSDEFTDVAVDWLKLA